MNDAEDESEPLANPRWEAFCRSYVERHRGNATAAYLDAGYSNGPGAPTSASRMLKLDQVRERIEWLRLQDAKRFEVTRERVVLTLAARAFYDPARLMTTDGEGNAQIKPLDQMTIEERMAVDVVGGVRGVRMGLANRAEAADKLARVLGLYDDHVRLEAGDTLTTLMASIHATGGGTPIDRDVTTTDVATRVHRGQWE